MNLPETLRRWWDRIDRERVQAFAQFLWTRFLDDRCWECDDDRQCVMLPDDTACISQSRCCNGLCLTVETCPSLDSDGCGAGEVCCEGVCTAGACCEGSSVGCGAGEIC